MLQPELEKQLKMLMKIFLEENQKLNLSAFRTEESCWIGNILDSLALLDIISHLPFSLPQMRIVDVGTGGGFPLLPLALALKGAAFVGLDATKKKIDAVSRVIKKMNTTNVSLVAGRSEEFGHDETYREKFDIVLSRAVAGLPTLLEYCSPFVKVNGHIVLWKSLSIEQELTGSLRAAKEFQCELVMQHRYTLPGNFGERQLLVFRKTAPLSKKYPRAVGVPKKSPIL